MLTMIIVSVILENKILEMIDYSKTPDYDVFAKIHTGIQSETDEWAEYCMADDPYIVNDRMCYGVSKNSKQKELALRIMNSCFTDPDIAKLMQPDTADIECAEERISLMKDEHAVDFKKFEAHISPESEAIIPKYVNLFSEAILNRRASSYNLSFTVDGFWENLKQKNTMRLSQN